MGKVKDPILFSKHFEIDTTVLDAAGLIDPFLNVDTQLFIAPVLLAKSANPVISGEALAAFKKHFDSFIRLLTISEKEDDRTRPPVRRAAPWRWCGGGTEIVSAD